MPHNNLYNRNLLEQKNKLKHSQAGKKDHILHSAFYLHKNHKRISTANKMDDTSSHIGSNS
jgi:hypothetical protein